MNEQQVLKKMKKLMKKRGLTYQQVGERMGYPKESARQSVNQVLNSKNPTLKMFLKLAEAIGVEPKDLL